jgi:hypothetical protein
VTLIKTFSSVRLPENGSFSAQQLSVLAVCDEITDDTYPFQL